MDTISPNLEGIPHPEMDSPTRPSAEEIQQVVDNTIIETVRRQRNRYSDKPAPVKPWNTVEYEGHVYDMLEIEYKSTLELIQDVLSNNEKSLAYIREEYLGFTAQDLQALADAYERALDAIRAARWERFQHEYDWPPAHVVESEVRAPHQPTEADFRRQLERRVRPIVDIPRILEHDPHMSYRAKQVEEALESYSIAMDELADEFEQQNPEAIQIRNDVYANYTADDMRKLGAYSLKESERFANRRQQ